MINICASNFKKATIEVDVSNCYKNSNDNNYSDDYYFVTATINCPSNLQWKIERLFDDPYSGETGLYPLRTGYGSTEINLYEFLIQEEVGNLSSQPVIAQTRYRLRRRIIALAAINCPKQRFLM